MLLAGAYRINDKSAVLTFAEKNPAGTLLPLLCVFNDQVCSLDCLGIKALLNRPRKVSLSLNDTDHITAPSVQAVLAFENISVLTHLAHD